MKSLYGPTKLERDYHLTLLLLPGLQTLLFTFTMLWMSPSKNGVDWVEISIFIYWRRQVVKSFLRIKIKTIALFYLILAA